MLRRHHIIIPIAATIAILPLLIHGVSCGHDIAFHLQSWLDAARQFRGGTLYPQWAYTPAWQAGEPRFIFYPPLSWMLGALLTTVLPIGAAPIAFIWLALLGAGFAMFHLGSRFASPDAALLASCVYLANPYMLFNAFERASYAELLASVWIPLVLLAALREQPSAAAAALPLALAWLTNAPSGVMATYTFVVVACVRIVLDVRASRHRRREAAATQPEPRLDTLQSRSTPLRNTLSLASGLALGLALPAFYLLPAAYERRYVQVAMAIIPNLRYQDNFLFSRTDYIAHNVVTRTVSLLAVAMLIATACTLFALVGQHSPARRFPRRSAPPSPLRPMPPSVLRASLSAAVLFALILFLLLPVSAPVWHLTPELPFLQFPWRLLTILSAVLALSLALALRFWQRRSWLAIAAALAVVVASDSFASPRYRQRCDVPRYPQYVLDTFRTGHGVSATDEYTPGDADNDVLRTGSPAFWLAPASDPSAYAPGTWPNPNETDPNYDAPIPLEHTLAEEAPHHLQLDLPTPAVLVLNLRDYPDWRVTRNHAPAPPHLRRDDGLLAIPLPRGPSTVDITWHRGADVYLGDTFSLLALAALLLLAQRSRRINPAVPSSVHAP